MKYFWHGLVLSSSLLITTNSFAATSSETWGYSGAGGPDNWGQLRPDFIMCKTGQLQSPINILSQQANPATNALTFDYSDSSPMYIVENGYLKRASRQNVENGGHGIQLNFPKADEHLSFQGKTYQLQQFHIHTPSENELNGQQYPMEIHFVHKGPEGQGLVIAVFVQEGNVANPTLQKIIDNFPKSGGKQYKVDGEHVNPADLIPSAHTYYSFMGSLTTPPCTEGIQWVVLTTPITASAAQIQAFKTEADGTNARPLQPLNNRAVFSAPDSAMKPNT